MSKFTADFFKAAAIRAIRTGAQVALSMIAVGMTLTEVDWLNVLSVVAMAMIVSILTSIVTDLPEAKIDGTATIDSIMYENDVNIKPGDTIRLRVTDEEEV
jgi:hypothetical protein